MNSKWILLFVLLVFGICINIVKVLPINTSDYKLAFGIRWYYALVGHLAYSTETSYLEGCPYFADESQV